MRSALSRLAPLVSLGFVVAPGCQSAKPPEPRGSQPQADLQPVQLDYVDSDAFDLLFETSLRNGPPVVVIQTGYGKPEWGARLNAWIAAWNLGRGGAARARGQIPGTPTVVVDGDSIREFRLLVDGLMGRVEESARTGTRWWEERHMRERRVALLRPYNLRFHLDPGGRIQLVLFHEAHAAKYEGTVRALFDPAGGEALEWAPGYSCSRSKQRTTSATGAE
ncbi:hypothetical protein GobsT_72010 [Gemmata obscuriglobus]|uniref:Uncharacterized protein n=1 Tax=Gemmata obscuriglobus TaxID=114 RepID=A0A2Z3HFG8_9BACT|nr:hypothetical protein [Gemmata obscuriglobus]AWM41705.1 hypothetical protein C1280_35070 [Gemmata obscuriglobus]QEG32346.1 hypothetical protein GobsT_72010 [Gemmata obscuriglobus]VTS11702.1 unnamed protein product [Gemmata obscuriglobus UQM 2246]